VEDQLRICIVETDPLVSQDISETFLFWILTAEVATFTSITDMIRDCRKTRRPDLVVLSADRHGELRATETEFEWLERLNVIAFDMCQKVKLRNWRQLIKPFSEPELIDAAKSILNNTTDRVPNCRSC
jgi:hypothetical protein